MSIPHPAILSNVSSLSIRFPAGHCIIGSLGNPHKAWLLLMLLDVEVSTCAQLLELLTISFMAEHFNLFVIVNLVLLYNECFVLSSVPTLIM